MVRTARVGVAVAGLLGASLLLAGAGTAQASPGGKWWNPGRGSGFRMERPAPRAFSRQWRPWGGGRVYRDVIVIRSSRYPRYRAWRTYAPPEYIYSRRLIRVRPIRFVVAGVFGGAAIRGSWHDDGYIYGCNFCDARFRTYDAYRAHVLTCSHRPRGYRVECNDWNGAGPWDDQGWRDDDDRDGGYGSQGGYHVYDRDRDDDRDGGYGRDDRGYDRDDQGSGRDDRVWDRGDRGDDHDRWNRNDRDDDQDRWNRDDRDDDRDRSYRNDRDDEDGDE
jgi:hypothetical protein